ncbi:MAG: ISKra4 family transposase [Planctomycetota bacterium]
MNVADSTPSDNPESFATESPQQLCQRIDAMAEALKQNIKNAAAGGQSFDSVERDVRQSVFALGKLAVDLFVSLQGDGDLGDEVTTNEGVTLRRRDNKALTTLRSIFGTHHFRQFTYAPGPKKAIALRPLSARMLLPSCRWSYLLQQWTQMLSVDSAYQQAMDNLQVILGGEKLSVDTAEKINGQMGHVAGAYLDNPPKPDANRESKFIVATADCKGVPLVKEDAKKIAAFETARKNPGNRRMATVASVYTVDPHVRTAEAITDALFRENPEDAQSKPRPQPVGKLTTAHMPELVDDAEESQLRISGIHVAMAWINDRVTERRRPGQVLLVLMDGQESLWETFKLHQSFGVRTVPILDIVHVLSYIWEAAGLFEKNDGQRRAFTRDRLLRILGGGIKGVIKGLRRLGTSSGLQGEKKKDLARICMYLEKNSQRMKYDEYLRRGYPIASGVIEGACRHLVKDRMERSGMRWTLEGARSMLHVRSVFQSAYWGSFLADRMQRDNERTHPNRQLLRDYEPLALAC